MSRSFLKNFLFIFSLLAILSASPAAFGQDSKPFVGSWNGTIDVMGQSLDISVALTLDDEEKIQGTIDIPAQGATGLALSKFEIDGKNISFIIGNIPGEPTFKGELDEAGTKISGPFSQGEVKGSFSLEKE